MTLLNRGSQTYWKNYVLESDAALIEERLKTTSHNFHGEEVEIIYFESATDAPCVLISPGSAGHPLVFAELGYLIHQAGYNVFFMPKHGSATVRELIDRHAAVLDYINTQFNNRVGVYSEGLGGYVCFYAALAHLPFKSLICQNSPALLTEQEFQTAIINGKGAATRRRWLMPVMKFLLYIMPNMKIPIRVYLDFKEMVDTRGDKADVEKALVEKYLHDPDFDRSYTLSAVMSLISTPPPNALSVLRTPTMFLVPNRGITVPYIKNLFARLPNIQKRLHEVDGGVFWMVSHPNNAAKVICRWFGETL